MGDLHGVDGPPSLRLKAAASAGLSLLFVVVYSGTSWLTSLRTDVGTWYYEWERWIPFVPWMALPYMSIDLFFLSAPFVMRDRRELVVFTQRVTLAIAVAGVFFLVMPLQLAVERPKLDGLMGAAFGWFFAMDQPYNLCPSLHIALRTLLSAVYARYTGGWLKLAALVWFSLIGFSTLLLYQHHVVDVIGGFLLAISCFYLVPALPAREPVTTNRRVGCNYVGAAAALAGLAMIDAPPAKLLLWPAASCGIAALGYFGLGPNIYRKSAGRLPWSTRLVLAPILAGQYLSLLYYQRQCRPWDIVTPQVWIGRVLSEDEARQAIAAGVTAVLDLTAEFSENGAFLGCNYLNVPVLDLTAPTSRQLCRSIAFIDEHVTHGVLYVHCKIGYSRSAAVVAAYLAANGAAATAEECIERLRAVRPSIVIRPEVEATIRGFFATVGGNTIRSRDVLFFEAFPRN
ncbi:MAG TPA: phosphatase PAP2/dual specificity phosphatase family protein [Pirellulales bacterium]|nr:phosphatase PAP2/dual specificity phosphatase family protein [Pirellulales bacterium]